MLNIKIFHLFKCDCFYSFSYTIGTDCILTDEQLLRAIMESALTRIYVTWYWSITYMMPSKAVGIFATFFFWKGKQYSSADLFIAKV